jgi:hypothetical protein
MISSRPFFLFVTIRNPTKPAARIRITQALSTIAPIGKPERFSERRKQSLQLNSRGPMSVFVGGLTR